MISLTILIPAYNEAGAIGDVIRKCGEALTGKVSDLEVLVVDDGSSDGTAEAASQAGARVVLHGVNRGYGRAILTGVGQARHPWIGLIDADGSYAPSSFLDLLPYVEKYDMVVGARTGSAFWGSVVKLPARLMFHQLAEFVTGQKIPDLNSGLRFFRKDDLRSVELKFSQGFSFTTTLTVAYLSENRSVRFTPIPYHSRVGRSKVHYLRDTLRAAQILVQAVAFYNPLKAVLPLVALQAVPALFLFVIWFLAGFPSPPLIAGSILLAGACTTCAIGMAMDVFRTSSRRK